MRLLAEDVDYLCDLGRVATRARAVMHLRYVDGYADAAIAAELGLREVSVRAYASEAWKRIRSHELVDLDELIRMMVTELNDGAGDPELEDVRQHARQLLMAIRGAGSHAPSAAGAPRPPVMTVAEAEKVVKALNRRRDARSSQAWERCEPARLTRGRAAAKSGT